MTPDELVEIRAEADQETYGDRTIRALCDALEAAWAERETCTADICARAFHRERERAERAESSRDRWEATAREMEQGWTEDRAALARVRALCDTGRIFRLIEGDDYVTAEIRAALDQREGDQ